MRQIFSKEQLVCSRIQREYRQFQYHVLKLKKKDIMDMCSKIRFYHCVREFFQYNSAIPEDVFLFLLPRKNIIYSMWELYLKHEALECSTWESIYDVAEIAEYIEDKFSEYDANKFQSNIREEFQRVGVTHS